MSGITPSQTIGPFAAPSLTPNEKGRTQYDWKQLITNNTVTPDAAGERIRIEGQLLDGAGKPLDGVLLETWQADSQGRYAHPRDGRATNSSFKGFGRIETDSEGRFVVETIKPGQVPGPNGSAQAPHIVVAIHLRGILSHLYSRIYFWQEADEYNMREWLNESRTFRKTLPELVREYLKLQQEINRQGDAEAARRAFPGRDSTRAATASGPATSSRSAAPSRAPGSARRWPPYAGW